MTDFDKIEANSLTKSIFEQLLGKIISGSLKAGDWLPSERNLAAQMGVSRSSLHQAILQLELDGFLELVPRKGTQVLDYRKQPTPQSLSVLMSYDSEELDEPLFHDMMEIRLWLETECVRKACANPNPAILDEMDRLVKDMEDTTHPADIIYEYHFKLCQASGNSMYSMIFQGFQPVIKTLIAKHYVQASEDLIQNALDCQALTNFVRSQDKEKAEQKLRQILERGIAVLKQKYQGAD